MMLSFALVSVLAAPVAAADAPVELAPPPAPAPAPASTEIVVAPAPAPAEPTPAPAELAPAPAPAPATSVTVIETPSSSVIVVQPEPTPAPTVVVTPRSTLSPPAPTWGPVRPTVPAAYDEERIRQTMRAHRRSAAGAFAVGGVGMGIALVTQYVRFRSLQHCATQDTLHSEWCVGSMNVAFSRYGGLGMAMFVAGTAGAGAMLGNAAATRDVQLRGGDVRRRTGLKLLGVAAIGAGAAWMIGANLQLGRHEAQCEGDPACLLRYRPLRWAANDGAALGIAAGAGMVGYAIGYERQGKALMQLRAAPSVGARYAGAGVTMTF